MLRQRLRDRDDKGFSLVELLVAMLIFSLLMALLTGLLITIMNQANDNLGRQRAVEQARLGLSQIDRQIRSGNLILDPGLDGEAVSGVPENFSLRIYTKEGGEDMCVQWRVIFPDAASDFGALEFRSWQPADISTATSWHRVASNLVAPTVVPVDDTDSQSWPPFWLDPSLPTGSDAQNIRVTLRLSDPSARSDAKPQVLTSVVTGRNTVFGYSALNCATAPPY